MSVRVGRILRHEDIHGVSGVGDNKADVFEASDGTCVIRWLGKDGSTNVYASVKNAMNVHSHGGKTEIAWIWEQEDDPDPMDKVFEKKLTEAGVAVSLGATAPTGPVGHTAGTTEATLDAVAERLADAARAASENEDAAVDAIADRLALKVSKKLVEKVAATMTVDEEKDSDPSEEEEISSEECH